MNNTTIKFWYDNCDSALFLYCWGALFVTEFLASFFIAGNMQKISIILEHFRQYHNSGNSVVELSQLTSSLQLNSVYHYPDATYKYSPNHCRITE